MKREGVDMTYLKNVIMKLLETGIHCNLKRKKQQIFEILMILKSFLVTGEVEALLPVIAMLLQLSPDEV